MKSVIKILMVALVIGMSSCSWIDNTSHGEHVVAYYGNIAGVDLKLGKYGYIIIHVDADKDGKAELDVILPNSYIDKVNSIGSNLVELLVISASFDSWYVIEVITQPNVKDYLELEEIPDTTKIILK